MCLRKLGLLPSVIATFNQTNAQLIEASVWRIYSTVTFENNVQCLLQRVVCNDAQFPFARASGAGVKTAP